jgi:hypothetical protein
MIVLLSGWRVARLKAKAKRLEQRQLQHTTNLHQATADRAAVIALMREEMLVIQDLHKTV